MELTEMHAEWGRRIRRLRRDKELTVTAVAQAAGITRAYLHRIENGEQSPSDDVRLRIASALDVEPGELFNYDLKDAS